MNKTHVIIILAVLSFGLLSYIVYSESSNGNITAMQAKDRVDQFVNGTLLPTGTSADITDPVEENGLYKFTMTLPDGSPLDSYITKDGKLFFPEGIDIDEVTKQIAAEDLSAQMQSSVEGDLEMETLVEGTGENVVGIGDNITVDYTGTLLDGTKFDSSIDRGEPFTFNIGFGEVIEGWDQGLIGMKVGEERKLTIPSNMAYGPSAVGTIPANSTLVFTVKLISIN